MAAAAAHSPACPSAVERYKVPMCCGVMLRSTPKLCYFKGGKDNTDLVNYGDGIFYRCFDDAVGVPEPPSFY